MARKRRTEDRQPETDWTTERSLAAAEEDRAHDIATDPTDVRCACGSDEFLLEAYLHVVAGRPRPDFVEVETLTCPACNREYEAVQGEGGTILKGDFVGYAEDE